MKKIILILAVIILTGCTSIDNISYDEIISEIVSSKYEIYNENIIHLVIFLAMIR